MTRWRASDRAHGIRRAFLLGAVLIPVAAAYALLLAIYTDWFPGHAASLALEATLTAAALSVPVWWLSGRIEWPDRLGVGFYLIHLALAVTFALLWLALDLAATRLLFGDSVATRKLASMGWEALLGSWLYGQVIGISYAVRAQSSLQAERRTTAKVTALAAEAQLRALRAQLNPHFLFNALHSLSALITVDPKAADEAIERLGGLLRYAFASENASTVPLASDLAFAEDYIALERLRLGSRLQARFAIDPAALECEIPVFTLQPLLENAVRHGIDPLAEGGTVCLEARLAEGTLVVTVSDNGAGAVAASVAAATGLGLRALRERLALSTRPFDLAIDTARGHGFTVRLTLPDAT